jgi:hypothetical protein
MGLTIAQLETQVRAKYPKFSHVKFPHMGFTSHYIGRWNFTVMNSANQIGYGTTYFEALKAAVREIKKELLK